MAYSIFPCYAAGKLSFSSLSEYYCNFSLSIGIFQGGGMGHWKCVAVVTEPIWLFSLFPLDSKRHAGGK
jgi:hypothetical protein